MTLVSSHAALAVVYDLARWPWVTFLLLGGAFASFFWAARRFQSLNEPTLILGVAALLRLFLLPLPPSLSDDTLRYVWDGKVLAAGFNPYRLPPESPELAALRDPLWERMPHKEVPTVYPPLALAFFTAASVLPRPLTSVKILLCLAELVGCWFLLRLGAARGLPRGRAAWYCWNPLVALAVAGMGHVDGLLAATMVAAVWFLVSRRPAAAGAAAAAGVLAKLVPLVALPLWARGTRAIPFLGVAAAVLVMALLPVAAATGGAPGLVEYGISWEFNGPVYEPLWRLFDRIELTDTVKAAFDGLKEATGRHELWNRFYPFVYPQLLAKVVLLGLFGILFGIIWWRERDVLIGTGRLMGAVVICAATVYPWYLLWVLPWAALARHRAWLALAVLSPLAYLPQLAGWPLFPWIWLAIWGPFFLLLGRSSWSID